MPSGTQYFSRGRKTGKIFYKYKPVVGPPPRIETSGGGFDSAQPPGSPIRPACPTELRRRTLRLGRWFLCCSFFLRGRDYSVSSEILRKMAKFFNVSRNTTNAPKIPLLGSCKRAVA